MSEKHTIYREQWWGKNNSSAITVSQKFPQSLSSRLWKNLHPLPQNEKLVHTYYLKGDRSNSFLDFKHFLKTYLMRKKTIGKTLWFSKLEIFIAPGHKGWFIQLSTVGHLSLVTEKYFETMWEFPGDRLIMHETTKARKKNLCDHEIRKMWDTFSPMAKSKTTFLSHFFRVTLNWK